MAHYLGPVQEKALYEFKRNDTLTEFEKNELFTKTILPSLKKLSKNLLDKYNLTGDHDLKDDCTAHMITRIGIGTQKKKSDYDEVRGNPFSFFNRVGMNFLLQHLKKKNKQVSILSASRRDANENPMGLEDGGGSTKRTKMPEMFIDDSYLVAGEGNFNELFESMKNEFGRILARTTDRREREFVQNMLSIFERKEDITIKTRNDFFELMRTMGTLKSRDITRCLTKVKKRYLEIKEEQIEYYTGADGEGYL